jgi:hypothetical protein
MPDMSSLMGGMGGMGGQPGEDYEDDEEDDMPALEGDDAKAAAPAKKD